MDGHAELIEELRERLQESEFYRWAGIELVDAGSGHVEIAFEAGAQHVNVQGLVHGGMLATLADTAMGFAVRTVLDPGRRHVTVQLGIEFLSPGDRAGSSRMGGRSRSAASWVSPRRTSWTRVAGCWPSRDRRCR